MSLRRRCFRLIAALVIAPYIITPFYGIINPPSLAVTGDLMRGQRPVQHWQPLRNISPWMVRSVIVAEDSAYCRHRGVDTGALEQVFSRAIRRGEMSHGASTIAMQTAKNLFLWIYPDLIRKPLEVPLALWMDAVLGKKRLMEIYLNIAQTGPAMYGVSAASQRYFGLSATHLSPWHASRIAASLPNPSSRPANALGMGSARYAGTIMARSPQADMHCFFGRR